MALTLRENICSARKLPKDQDVLMGRAELLCSDDRELLEAIMIRGQTVGSVSHMMGMSPRRVANRVRKLSARLSSRRFLDAARALRYLSRSDATVARLRFCEGLSERQLSQKLGLSPHAVRRRVDQLSAQIAAIRRLGPVRNRSGRTKDTPSDTSSGSRRVGGSPIGWEEGEMKLI